MNAVSRLRALVQDGWRALRRPEVQTDIAQVLKATLATVTAWMVAVHIFDLQQAFLAPWTALLTVHATVYRTLWRGSQAVIATAVGILLSFLAVQTLGYGAFSLGVAVLLGLLIARTPLIREEGIAVATTALFVITAGYGDQEQLLLHRLLDTLVGVSVGMLVNVLVRPPLDDRIAEHAIARARQDLGVLLQRIAREVEEGVEQEGVQAWVERTREIDTDLDNAESQLSFTRESQWANPRRRGSPDTLDVDDTTAFLVRLEEGVAQGRAIARVVDEAVVEAQDWDEDFRQRWTELLGRVGARIADPDLEVMDLRADADRMVVHLSHEGLSSLHWPVYGALITAVVNLLHVMDDVAAVKDRITPE
ncbi:MAG: aromatic acid exporter family protein [Nocardioides sp.]|nr:aromatic acid exporter family protein [Nocardioides sp.]